MLKGAGDKKLLPRRHKRPAQRSAAETFATRLSLRVSELHAFPIPIYRNRGGHLVAGVNKCVFHLQDRPTVLGYLRRFKIILGVVDANHDVLPVRKVYSNGFVALLERGRFNLNGLVNYAVG
jgi:hypothetical protein